MVKTSFLRSTSVRLSLQFALLYILVTACVLFAAYRLTGYEITSWVEDQLISEEAALVQIYQTDGLDGVIAQTIKFNTLNFENYRIFALTDATGEQLAGNVSRLDWDLQGNYVPLEQVGLAAPSEIEAAGYVVRAITLGPNRLIIGTSTHFEAELLEALANAFGIGFLLVGLLGAGAGIIVGRKTEGRLTEVSAALTAVSAGKIETRVPVIPKGGDDLSRVSREVNKTLANLQKLVESQQQISADIAHDLKTPLQRLRQRLERMGDAPALPAALGHDVDQALEAVDDLIATFNALLRISQIEAGNRHARFGPVDLGNLLLRIEDAYGAVAEEMGQTLSFSAVCEQHVIIGDAELLTQMLANTVENALRHCPSGSVIEVKLKAGAAGVSVIVADNGPGIPETDRERVFRRFFRLEKSRTSAGNGLGLSLVKAIADLHSARITLSSNNPGLQVEISLPQ